jgi:N-glycosylase/DNA lyase
VEAFWSPWQDVVLPEALSPRVLEEILDGGQAFRWHLQAGRTWMGVWAGHAAELRLNAAATLQARSPVASGTAGGAAVRSYLDAGRSARTLADALPWRSDAHLARCLEAFPGLRLLRQPFGETLLCFLCSAAKQVLQIKQMAACMAERHGPPLFPGRRPPPATPPFSTAFRPGPSWRNSRKQHCAIASWGFGPATFTRPPGF